jgi:RNA polymerase sigma factor (sigma-70 family)
VLRESVRENPFKTIAAAWNGTLDDYLVVAAINDVWDEVNRGRAKKRDVRKEENIDDVNGTVKHRPAKKKGVKKEETMADLKPSESIYLKMPRSEEPLEIVAEKDNWIQMMNQLTEAEKEVATLLVDGWTQQQVAEKMHKSQQWVSETLKKIQVKLEPLQK